jgi:hypothetical protein
MIWQEDRRRRSDKMLYLFGLLLIGLSMAYVLGDAIAEEDERARWDQ